MICGLPLEYAERAKEVICTKCGKSEKANVFCPEGHYVCEECHGTGAYDFVREFVLYSQDKDPLAIAESLLNHNEIFPMLGCEHAMIAAGALLAAIKNEGTLKLSGEDIEEALQRTQRQAVGGYCGLTGVCGIAPAIGACFSVVLGAACPGNRETAVTMRVVARVTDTIAAETGPCCCKSFVRSALATAVGLVKEYLNIYLPVQKRNYHCLDSARHPHGCRKEKCLYY